MFSTCTQELQLDFQFKISLYKVTKSINSQTNNKSPGNDDLTAEFYRYFSNRITFLFRCLLLLGKPWQHGAISIRGIISVMYKFRLQKFKL